MITRQYAAAMSRVRADILRKQTEIEGLYTIAAGMKALTMGDRVQSSADGDKMSDCICKIADKKQELLNLKEQEYNMASAMSDLIGCIVDGDERMVLVLRHMQGLKHEEIADRIGKSLRQEKRICRSAEDHLEVCQSTDEYTHLLHMTLYGTQQVRYTVGV